jgi:lysophospholipase L1-like esterase
MPHVVLFGDSIFDNKSYVGAGGKDVITHLREVLPDDWMASLNAVDGAVIQGASRQFLDIPPQATHFVISVGGNDAIQNADILEMRAGSASQVFGELAKRKDAFENQYSEMLKNVLSKNIPTALCTIYYPNFPDALMQRLAVTALASFNDVIIRQAILNNLPLLDLRLICNEASDYANPIEPSDKGGRKIARKIFDLVSSHDFSNGRTQIFA